MKLGTRSLKKYAIFPCCLLLFGVLEEVMIYLSEGINNSYLRVAAVMAFYAFGISLLAFAFTPLMEKLILKLHATSKLGAGRIGEYVFLLLLLAGVYILWYKVIIDGPASLLPPSWRVF